MDPRRSDKERGGTIFKGTFFTLREDCLRRKELFVDKNFPPSRDCWLLAAIATLTLNPKLFHFIVPCDQGFYYKYAGIFHFRFWQYGRWQDVYVDDLLPTYRGRLVFMHSKTKNEFWCALLEKAYAKLYGGYEALKGGNVGESMVDLSGGVVEMVDLREPPSNLFGMIRNACRRGAMMGEDERDKLGITFDDDGEFWMPFSDFISNFTAMDICDITPDVFTSQLDCDSDDEECIVKEQRHRQWKMRIMEGEWIQGKTAGGCRNFLDTFHMNPQKVVLLDRPDDDDPDNCTLVVSVMQKYVRQRKRYGIDYIPIGFAVYKLPPGVVPGRPLDTDFFRYNATCGRSPCFLNTREVSYHFSFPPGVYVVIPSTFEPDCEAEFLLRIFTESH
ncbi:Calpain-9 [Armadillidium vulgare]|nr:Calpain-9 [Armadillidium vulgare]